MASDPRPPVWVGHVTMPTPDVPATREFMLKLGMRDIEHGDRFAVLELRGGTHLLLLAADAPASGDAYFDLMVEDLDAAHAGLLKASLEPSAIERGSFHDSFTIDSPSGHRVKFNSTHVSDLPVQRVRFEHRAAYIMGVFLPLGEVARRRTNFDTISGYVDDFIVGAILLYAARAVSNERANGPAWLVAAWAILCGGLYGSFFWQLENGAALDVSGAAKSTMLVVKGVLYAISLVALARSIRAASSNPSG